MCEPMRCLFMFLTTPAPLWDVARLVQETLLGLDEAGLVKLTQIIGEE